VAGLVEGRREDVEVVKVLRSKALKSAYGPRLRCCYGGQADMRGTKHRAGDECLHPRSGLSGIFEPHRHIGLGAARGQRPRHTQRVGYRPGVLRAGQSRGCLAPAAQLSFSRGTVAALAALDNLTIFAGGTAAADNTTTCCFSRRQLDNYLLNSWAGVDWLEA
jgi:hypothetical protein